MRMFSKAIGLVVFLTLNVCCTQGMLVPLQIDFHYDGDPMADLQVDVDTLVDQIESSYYSEKFVKEVDVLKRKFAQCESDVSEIDSTGDYIESLRAACAPYEDPADFAIKNLSNKWNSDSVEDAMRKSVTASLIGAATRYDGKNYYDPLSNSLETKADNLAKQWQAKQKELEELKTLFRDNLTILQSETPDYQTVCDKLKQSRVEIERMNMLMPGSLINNACECILNMICFDENFTDRLNLENKKLSMGLPGEMNLNTKGFIEYVFSTLPNIFKIAYEDQNGDKPVIKDKEEIESFFKSLNGVGLTFEYKGKLDYPEQSKPNQIIFSLTEKKDYNKMISFESAAKMLSALANCDKKGWTDRDYLDSVNYIVLLCYSIIWDLIK